MVQSMTGFGASENNNFRVEVRSLNHRYMDISIRLPQFLHKHDIPLRNIIKQRFKRGKFDAFVSLTGEKQSKVTVNKALASVIYNALNELKKELSLEGTIDIGMIAQYKDVFLLEEEAHDVEALYAVFNEAVSSLEQMREQEGRALSAELVSRVEAVGVLNRQVRELCSDVLHNCKSKMSSRLKTLLEGAEPDEGRIMQEAAILAEKADITEEVTRIESHVREFSVILLDGDAPGRKLDFLLQELNRETNTIASKVNDIRVSQAVIEMKSEIEKIREQVQNIQ